MNGVKTTDTLRAAYGDDIILYDEQNESAAYRIVAEFIHDGQGYAVLQSEALREEDEVAIFRVVANGGVLELENIEDDDEWETVSELYDEMLFPLEDE
ncbi:hypothetical protein SD70_09695 [Gordoniibacillus kamchatkensis]|uniref:DUF1292 domain-containing protein n=1 Tax=Gordoniibacillus kamchatkensis TaxID=1590651 RepID=A0ABR5AL26_9BACL|nr:DUF1292 domain-containing protein [Paenibacillus sp. VKM B-2647]KIL41067.1 hypothetical protein SD70_09695 [Paenibacillus sp. VKM B-2647]